MAGGITLTVVGNLTGEVEVRQVGGANVASFSVASTERKFQNGEWVDGATTFVRCSAWRDLADHVAASLTKGTRVIATGIFRQRDYETREGEKRTSFELEVEEVGPSLKYATAAVERRQGNRNQAARREQFAAQGQPQGQPRPVQQQQPAQPLGGGWGAAAYDDETPF